MDMAVKWFQDGVTRQNAGASFEAVVCYRNALALGRKTYEVYYNLGLALQAIGREDEAIVCYTQASRLNPKLAEAYNNLGNIFQKREQLEEAQASYERALAINPNLIQSRFNLGLVLRKRGAWSKAAEHFRAAWQLAPDYVEAWDNLRDILSALKRTEESLETFLAFEKTAQPSSFLILAGLSTCRCLGDFEREKRYLELVLNWEFSSDDSGMAAQLLGMIQYFDVEQRQLLQLYQRYNSLILQRNFIDVPLLPPRRTRGDKLRVGYLSPDFRTHVMGHLMVEVLARHNTNQFEIYAYSLAEPIHDDVVTARFRELSHKFVPVAKLSEREAARKIAEDDLDILVDLGGQTSSCKPAILAYKPARIQVTHLGYHGAVGLEAVDYKLTDSYTDLPENEAFLLESLLPMEGCVFPFRHVAPAHEHGYSRAALSLEGKIVFGVFVNVLKLSPRCLSVWREVLDKVVNGVLAFSPLDPGEYPSFVRQVKAAGIPEERIVFIPSAKDESVGRARYHLVDIVLDTFPYSGGDTTLAALDMGVPVVTLVGKRHSERTTYSILKNLGVESTIAFSEPDFVTIACRLASDKEFCQNVRNEIQSGLKISPLVNMNAYVHNLEDAYLRALSEKALVPSAQGALTAEELRSLFQNALRFHQENQLTEAESLYRKVLTDQAEYAPACYLLGMLLKAKGDASGARLWLEKAVQGAPRYTDAWASLGRLDFAEQHDVDAIKAFRRVLEFRPGAADILNDLGLALDRMGQKEDALKVFQQAVAVNPSDAGGHFNMGTAYQKLNLLDEAIAEYGRAIMLQPDFIDAFFNLGSLLQGLEQWEKAAGCYRRILEVQPKHAASRQCLAEISHRTGILQYSK